MWYIVAFAVGMLVGCGAALGEITTESERLGAFYVGNKVYYVTKIEERK